MPAVAALRPGSLGSAAESNLGLHCHLLTPSRQNVTKPQRYREKRNGRRHVSHSPAWAEDGIPGPTCTGTLDLLSWELTPCLLNSDSATCALGGCDGQRRCARKPLVGNNRPPRIVPALPWFSTPVVPALNLWLRLGVTQNLVPFCTVPSGHEPLMPVQLIHAAYATCTCIHLHDHIPQLSDRVLDYRNACAQVTPYFT